MWGMFVHMLYSDGMCTSHQTLCTGCTQRLHTTMYVCLCVYMHVHSFSMSIPEVSRPIDKFTIYVFHKNTFQRWFLYFFSLYGNFYYNIISPDSQQVSAFKYNLIQFFSLIVSTRSKLNTAKWPVNIISLFFKYFSVPIQISTPHNLPRGSPGTHSSVSDREGRHVLSFCTCETA